MLQDKVNTVAAQAGRAVAPAAGSKRSWEDDDSDAAGAFPHKFVKRLGEPAVISSSSSSHYGASSSPFPNTRFEAYDASTSPPPLPFSKSRLSSASSPSSRGRAASSLPPSSPPLASPVGSITKSITSIRPRLEPVQGIEGTPLVLHLTQTLILQFGRKAKRHQPPFAPSSTTPEQQILPILLPSSAKNASRLHATARIVSGSEDDLEQGPEVMEVRVLGQNGMKINGKLYRPETVATFPLVPMEKAQFKFGFWGWDAMVIVGAANEVASKPPLVPMPATPQRALNLVVAESPFDSLFDGTDHSPAQPQVHSRVNSHQTPASSRQDAIHEDHLMDSSSHPGDFEPAPQEPSFHSRSPSPVPSDLSSLGESPVLTPAALPTATSTPSSPHSRATAIIASHALDLPGLIASAIVFHPRSTVTVEEVVKGLLKEVGGMWDILEPSGASGSGASVNAGAAGEDAENEKEEKEEEVVELWWDVVERTLQEEQFFGCIANVGLRDAMGHPVPPAYFYNPDQDPSHSRVAALEPFVKRVRGARTAGGGKRYFWRRPTLKKKW